MKNVASNNYFRINTCMRLTNQMFTTRSACPAKCQLAFWAATKLFSKTSFVSANVTDIRYFNAVQHMQ